MNTLVEITSTAASLGVVALFALPALPLIYKGVREREWHPVSLPNTQRRRYAIVLCGQAMLLPVLVWFLANNSVGDIERSIEWCFTRGLVGYTVAILTMLALASPLLTATAMLIILRHPSEMAHKGPVKHSYCPTLFHRAGNCEFIHITVTLDLKTGEGVQHRTKL